MVTSRKSRSTNSPPALTSSLEELHARISPLLDSELDWMALVVSLPLSSFDLLNVCGPDGWYGRTSPVSCRLTEDGRLEPSSGRWGKSGMGSLTEFWTLNTLEFRKGAVASSLSDVLETGEVPRRFYLSAKACQGILRRAEKRGKALPTTLRRALEQVAEGSSEQGIRGDKTALSPRPEDASGTEAR